MPAGLLILSMPVQMLILALHQVKYKREPCPKISQNGAPFFSNACRLLSKIHYAVTSLITVEEGV